MDSAIIKKAFEDVPYLKIPDRLKEDLSKLADIPYVDGCGTNVGPFAGMAPSTIDGVCIFAACLIHDSRYYYGETLDDKNAADIEFFNNLVLILSKSPDILTIGVGRRQLRFDEALVFFRFVNEYGLKSFVAQKDVAVRDLTLWEYAMQTIDLTFRATCIPFQLVYNALMVKWRLRKNVAQTFA